ncbi:MAG: hypothetical protein ABIQ44_01910 [Chloroflexia bacterium]
MAKIKRGSRRIVLLAAFVSVMSAAGGLIGAVTGAVFILLMRSMFNMSSGIGEFMLAMVLLGAGLVGTFGLMLTVEKPRRLIVRSGLGGSTGIPVPVTVLTGTDGQ